MYAGWRGRLTAGTRTLSVAMAGVLAAATLAACGSDSSSSSTSATTTPAASTSARQPSGEPMKVMVDAPVGTAAADQPGVFASAQAAAVSINAAGGVNGRPLEIVTCNSRLTANGAAACARRAASEKVVAVTGQDSFTDGYRPILEDAGIPSTLVPTSTLDVQIPLQFPVNGGYMLELFGAPLAAQRAGARTIAIASLEFPGAEANLANGKRAAEALGMEVVKVIGVPLTQTTFGTTVQELRDADPDAVIMYLSAPQIANLVQTARQQGFTPAWATAEASFNVKQFQTFAQASDNLWLVSALPPATAGDEFPGIARYNAEMDAAGEAGVSDTGTDQRDANALNTWVQVHGLAQVAATIRGDVTAESMLAALRSTENLDIEGLVEWSPGGTGYVGFPKITDGGALYVGPVEDGAYTPEQDPVKLFEEIGLEPEPASR